jgi:hypothetical protein
VEVVVFLYDCRLNLHKSHDHSQEHCHDCQGRVWTEGGCSDI